MAKWPQYVTSQPPWTGEGDPRGPGVGGGGALGDGWCYKEHVTLSPLLGPPPSLWGQAGSDAGVGAGQRQRWGEAAVRCDVPHPRGGWSEQLGHKDSEEW